MKTIQIKSCQSKDCGDSFDGNPWWGSKEPIKAGENKRVRVMPITVGKLAKKAA